MTTRKEGLPERGGKKKKAGMNHEKKGENKNNISKEARSKRGV